MIFNYDWAYAFGMPSSTATLKGRNDDFEVTEIANHDLTGDGEHLWLWIEKTGENTQWVADQLAKWAGVKSRDVSYAGRKDRYAITRQWFSIYLPGKPDPKTKFPMDTAEILMSKRNSSKLRRGSLMGNRFKIKLTDIVEPRDLERRLSLVQAHGVPNYFGDQRFGRDFSNVPNAVALGEKRKLKQRGNDIYLSAARSFLFNQVVSHQVRNDEWLGATAPMWGRGRPLAHEQCILKNWRELCDMLEHTGLSQERRNAQLDVSELSWTWEHDQIDLDFFLPAGSFATSVVRELVRV